MNPPKTQKKMRTIEKKMAEAVSTGRDWKQGNTAVMVADNGDLAVTLFGNPIYERCVGGCVVYWSLAGWDTRTTRSRLRALGINVRRRRGVTYCDAKPVNKDRLYDYIDLGL